jgi:hypothetical protein
VIKPFFHWVYRLLFQGYSCCVRPLQAWHCYVKKKRRVAQQKRVWRSSFTFAISNGPQAGSPQAGSPQAGSPQAGSPQAGHTRVNEPLGSPNGDYILYAIPRADIVEALNHTFNQPTIPHHPLYGPPYNPQGPQQPAPNSVRPRAPQSSAPQSVEPLAARAPETRIPTTQEGDHRYIDHPDMVCALADSAYLCERQGRYLEAERLYQQVITLRQQRFGNGDLSLADSLLDLGTLYRAQERYSEAQPLFEQALTIRQHCLTHQHADVGNSLYQLAALYALQKQYRKAEPLYQQALEIARREVGPQHPHTQAIYSDFMQMIVSAIESGRFEDLLAELPPLDLDNLSKIYSWAKPHWERF